MIFDEATYLPAFPSSTMSKVVVSWPSGQIDTIKNVTADFIYSSSELISCRTASSAALLVDLASTPPVQPRILLITADIGSNLEYL